MMRRPPIPVPRAIEPAHRAMSQKGDGEGLLVPPALGQGTAQQKDAQKFLPVLGTVEEGGEGSPGDLGPAEQPVAPGQSAERPQGPAARPEARSY